ncbi:uncharacterized protein LOC141622124 [Silene latifolia]|uniref:uncharacterized protein LOC141622124 n=1 Tax=Silene latifolia TaxID=37657 RepID=UPI003D788642
MDKEQEQLQFLSFIGIFKESLKIILSCPKIFTKISLAFILPLSFISLLNVEISKHLINNSSTSNSQQLSPISSKLILFWVFEIVVGLIFSLLSISAVIYTVACIFTGKEVTFKKIMSVIPKVWKRLMITLISNFCILFAYILTVTFILIVCLTIIMFSSKPKDLQVVTTIFSIITGILVFVGLIYAAIFWQLSNVVSVMEEYCGFKAMKKSRQLIKGKIGTAIAIYLVLSICYVPIVILHRQLGQRDSNIGIGPTILYGILSIVLNLLIVLYIFVVHTVFYFVCKSYHHENINKSALADHLESFHGGYVPLIKGDVELSV